MPTNNYIDIMEKNHMEIPWHDYTGDDSNTLIKESGLIEKASVIGRVGLIMLSCGTGAWRVRTSMNRLSKELMLHVQLMLDLCPLNLTVLMEKTVFHSLLVYLTQGLILQSFTEWNDLLTTFQRKTPI